MIRFRNRLPRLLAALVGVVILGAPTPAQATFTVRVYEDGSPVTGGVVSLLDPQDVLYAFTTINSNLQFFQVTSGSGSSTFPGSQNFGASLGLSNSTKVITNFGGSGGTHTIRIEMTQDGWLAPSGTPLTLSSSGGGSYDFTHLGNSLAVTYQGFLDGSNTLFGQPVGGSTPLQTAGATAGTSVGTAGLSLSPGVSSSNVPAAVPFSMTDVLELKFTQAAGSGQDQVTFSASTVAVVPAPAGLVLALTGIPCMGLAARFRRRRQTA